MINDDIMFLIHIYGGHSVKGFYKPGLADREITTLVVPGRLGDRQPPRQIVIEGGA